jgi:hypothetical protein
LNELRSGVIRISSQFEKTWLAIRTLPVGWLRFGEVLLGQYQFSFAGLAQKVSFTRVLNQYLALTAQKILALQAPICPCRFDGFGRCGIRDIALNDWQGQAHVAPRFSML